MASPCDNPSFTSSARRIILQFRALCGSAAAEGPGDADAPRKRFGGSIHRSEVHACRAVYMAGLGWLLWNREAADAFIADSWKYLIDSGIASHESFEPILSSVVFFALIIGWKLFTIVCYPALKKYRVRSDIGPYDETGGVSRYMTPELSDAPILSALAYNGILIPFDILFPRRATRAYFLAPTPSALELISHVCLSVWLYDALFYFPHVAMHRIPWLYKAFHSQHHQQTALRSMHTLQHSLVDGAAQVLANIAVLNFLGLPAASRAVHNLVVIYLLVESHSGWDLPCMLHNVVPWGVLGGPPAHEAHHETGNAHFHQFFTYLDSTVDGNTGDV